MEFDDLKEEYLYSKYRINKHKIFGEIYYSASYKDVDVYKSICNATFYKQKESVLSIVEKHRNENFKEKFSFREKSVDNFDGICLN